MRGLPFLILTFTACFAAGFSLFLLLTAEASADPSPCATDCYTDYTCDMQPAPTCSGSCFPPELGLLVLCRCYRLSTEPCGYGEWPERNCCVQIGCALKCR